MKKTTYPLLFSASLLLAACRQPLPAASSVPSLIPSSSQATTDIRAFLQSTILAMAEGNFALTYQISGNSFTDVVNPRYTYISYLRKGSVLLQTYGETPYAYDFTIGKDGVEIRGQTYDESYQKQEVTSLAYRNHFANAANWKIEGEMKNDEFVTNSGDILRAFQNQLDFTGIQKLGFSIQNGALRVRLFAKDPLTGASYIPEGGDVVVSAIGNATLPEVETLLSTWQNDKNGWQGNVDNLTGNVSFVSAVYDDFYLEESNQVELQGYSNLDRYNDYVRITDIDQAGASRAYTYERQADGETLQLVGVNAKNEMRKTSTTTTYSSFHFFSGDAFPRAQFQKIGADQDYYTYLGTNATELAYAITQHQQFLEWPVVQVKAKEENGKFVQFVFMTDIMLDRDTNNYFYRFVDTRVKETANVIDGPIMKTPSPDDTEIQEYLSYLNQDDSVFTSIGKDSAWKGSRLTKATKGTDFYLKGTYYTDGQGNPTTLEKNGEGYFQSGDKLYSFAFNDAGEVVTFNKVPVDETLKEVAGFTLASAVLKKEGDILTTYGDILDLGSSIGAVDNPLTVDPSSFSMGLKDGKIATLQFAYQGGTEAITLDYATPTLPSTLRENLEKAVAALNPSERETFADDASKSIVYDPLVEQWGEEIAKKVPYLNNRAWEKAHDNTAYFQDAWYDDDTSSFFIIVYEIVDSYTEAYKAYLKELGYTSDDNITFESKTEGLKITVNSEEPSEFLSIQLLSA